MFIPSTFPSSALFLLTNTFPFQFLPMEPCFFPSLLPVLSNHSFSKCLALSFLLHLEWGRGTGFQAGVIQITPVSWTGSDNYYLLWSICGRDGDLATSNIQNPATLSSKHFQFAIQHHIVRSRYYYNISHANHDAIKIDIHELSHLWHIKPLAINSNYQQLTMLPPDVQHSGKLFAHQTNVRS